MRYIICPDCGKKVLESEALYVDGKFYCLDCVKVCLECGCYKRNVDMVKTEDNVNYVCKSCITTYNHFAVCADCGRAIKRNYHVYSATGNSRYVCPECLTSNYHTCSHCDRYFKNAELSNHTHRGTRYTNVCDTCWHDMLATFRREEGDTPLGEIYGYHSYKGRGNKSTGYRYRFGIELEKEDGDVRESLCVSKILKETGWCVESDGSLDYLIGFEAISPIYPLNIKSLKKIFSNPVLKSFAEAKSTRNCGGHITVSDTKRSPDVIIDDIAGYLPILYAMYPQRAGRGYCEATGKMGAKSGSRYAIHKRGNGNGAGIEFRIFDAPKSVDDILNRASFLRYILEHKAPTELEALEKLSDDTKLRKIILEHLEMYDMNKDEFFSQIKYWGGRIGIPATTLGEGVDRVVKF